MVVNLRQGQIVGDPLPTIYIRTFLLLTILTVSTDMVVCSVGGMIVKERGEKRIKRERRRMRKDDSRRTGSDEGARLSAPPNAQKHVWGRGGAWFD